MSPLRSTIAAAAAAAAAAALALAACGGGDDTAGGGGKLRVVATTTQTADLVRAVGGERVEVDGLLGPNADPHEYEPRPSDARAIAESRIAFRSGGDLDEWLAELLKDAGGDTATVTLIDGVRRLPGDGGEPDPHWWQDPVNAELATRRIAGALGEADREGRAAYEASAAEYIVRLRQLDRATRACLGRIPAARRKLVTSHDSLSYFTRRYGIELIGTVIPSRSSQAQASAGDTARLVKTIKREKVRAIFPESSLNPELERAVAREAGARVGRPLWADTLGPEGSSGATLIESIAANASALAEGFSGGRVRCPPAP